jgi:hypothetical protein
MAGTAHGGKVLGACPLAWTATSVFSIGAPVPADKVPFPPYEGTSINIHADDLRLIMAGVVVSTSRLGQVIVATQIVTYQLDDSTKVRFEVEPVEGFRPASAGQIAGRVRDAVGPAVDAAKAVLDKVKDVSPDEVEVCFGIKVSGGADWFVAKTAGEASFEIKLTWTPLDKRGAASEAVGEAGAPGRSN